MRPKMNGPFREGSFGGQISAFFFFLKALVHTDTPPYDPQLSFQNLHVTKLPPG